MVIPAKLKGMSVLDLGSGSGRDCYAISKLVGPNGHVTGLDMTDEQVCISLLSSVHLTLATLSYYSGLLFPLVWIELKQSAGVKATLQSTSFL